MKVILQQDVRGQGKKGQLVEVSDGYARNFLLPKKLAVPATAENVNTMKQQEKARQAQMAAEKAEAQALAEKLKSIQVKLTAKAGEGGRLFGAVTSKEIAEALSAQHGLLRLYTVGHLPQQQFFFLKRHGITFSFYGGYSTLQVRRAHSLIRKNRHSEAVTDVTAVGIRIQNIRENGLPRQSADWLAMTTAPYHLS